MEKSLLNKAIRGLKKLKPECVTMENDYIDNEVKPCFNGAILFALFGKDAYEGNTFDRRSVLDDLDLIYKSRDESGKYEDNVTKSRINDLHSSYRAGAVTFKEAIKKLITILKED